MENYINPILTIILIAIYWFNTKAQNSKIKAQSDIINDLKEHVKFFDLKKIKEYVELRESEKDKLLEITKLAVEKEFELKLMTQPNKVEQSIQKDQINNIFNKLYEDYIIEPYIYIAMNLVWKSDIELNDIMDKDFPKSKDFLLKTIKTVQIKIREKTGIDDLCKIKILMEEKK